MDNFSRITNHRPFSYLRFVQEQADADARGAAEQATTASTSLNPRLSRRYNDDLAMVLPRPSWQSIANMAIENLDSGENKFNRFLGKFNIEPADACILDLAHSPYIQDEDLKLLTGSKVCKSLKLQDCVRITDRGIAELQFIPSLTSVNLRHTPKISDNAVAHLQHCPNLQHVDISCCGAIADEGMAYFPYFPVLQSLNLDSLEITDEGLKHIAYCKTLEELDLKNCRKVTATGITHLLHGTPKLRRLKNPGSNVAPLDGVQMIHARGIEIKFPALGPASRLRFAKPWKDQFETVLDHLPQRDVGLISPKRSNDRHKKFFKFLEKFNMVPTAAGHLDFSHNELISDEDFLGLENSNFFQSLNLQDCERITDRAVDCLQFVYTLRALNLRHSPLISNFALSRLMHCENLQHLDLSCCSRINDAGMTHLQYFPRLVSLNLNSSVISDKGLARISGCQHLEVLDISCCSQVTNQGLIHIGRGLPNLRRLNLTGCNLKPFDPIQTMRQRGIKISFT